MALGSKVGSCALVDGVINIDCSMNGVRVVGDWIYGAPRSGRNPSYGRDTASLNVYADVTGDGVESILLLEDFEDVESYRRSGGVPAEDTDEFLL